MNQRVVTLMTTRLGYSLDIVSDGRAAVQTMADGNRYDLILMDCHLPELDGFEATRLIRQLEGARRAGADRRADRQRLRRRPAALS